MMLEATVRDFARLTAAIEYAAEMHKMQKRKADQSPYINHPIAVMNILVQCHAVDDDFDILAAAVLHDVVEDTEATIEDVRSRFGDSVAQMVAEVSGDKSLPSSERKRLQVEHMKDISLGATYIKYADKIHNLTDLATNPPPSWSLERVQGYFVWSKAVIANAQWHSDAMMYRLKKLFEGKITYKGEQYDAIPRDEDEASMLEAYYKSLE